MIDISHELVEEKLIEEIKEISSVLEIDISINTNVCPGVVPGITSQVLVSVMGRLEKKLDIIIPDDHYIFFDHKTKKQLDIKQSAEKLIKIAKHAK